MRNLRISTEAASEGLIQLHFPFTPTAWIFFYLFACLAFPFPVPDAHAQAETGLPPGDPFDLVSQHLEWNVWIEEAAPNQTVPSFQPLANPPDIRDYAWHLQPERDYVMVVHLSEHRYQDGMAMHPLVDSRIRQSFADALTSRPIPKTTTLIGTLSENPEPVRSRLSPPPRTKLTLGTDPLTMLVQLDRLLKDVRRRPAGTPVTEATNSFSLLAKRKDADFVYGQLVFRISTGKGEGMVELEVILTDKGQETNRLEKIVLCIASATNKRKACPPPVTAGMKGDDKAINELRWNFWTESRPAPSPQPIFQPAALKPNTGGRLVLDLAAIAYKITKGSVASTPVGGIFKESFREWLALPISDVTLTVVAIPDQAYLKLDGPQSQTLTAKLDTIRALTAAEQLPVEPNPFEALVEAAKKSKDPDWMIGRVHYPVKTQMKEGRASVAFSIWGTDKDGKSRPIDELTATFCIARDESTCQGPFELSRGSLGGVDSLKLATEPNAPFPDAALHFVPLSNEGPVAGVFRRNDRPEGQFSVWQLDEKFPVETLKSHLSESLLDAVAKATTDQDLRAKGRNLYNLLFYSEEEMDDGHKARLAFETFVRDRLKPAGTRSKDLPSVFVRLLGYDDLIPLGLLPIAASDNSEEFLGFRFRVETPLEVQSYKPKTGCIQKWDLVVPPDTSTGALKRARDQASGVITNWLSRIWGPGNPNRLNTMRKFEDWLAEKTEEPSPSAVVVLSHHNRNQLSFDSDDMAQSDAIQRRFSQPSIAIFNGCGTAKAGANEFIRQLNARGIGTVIATSAEVEGIMAGDFMNCLNAILQQHENDTGYTIAEAYLDTIRCLRTEKGHGARALKYTLLGNGNLRLCLPKKP